MQNNEQKLRDLLAAIVANIGRKTPGPEIDYIPHMAVLTLRVNPHDQGRFVGKKGIVIWAINTILWYAGIANFGYTIGVKLLEPNGDGQDRRAMPFRPDPNWDRKKLGLLVDAITQNCFHTLICPWVIEDTGEAEATVNLQLEKYLKMQCEEPNLAEAISKVIHAAGMAQGANIKTNISWK